MFLLRSKYQIRIALLLAMMLCMLEAPSQARGQSTYQPSPANLEARRWFQDAKFGLFIHWGVYSVLGDGEWVMNNRKLTVEEYEKLPSFFNPLEYDPAEWVTLAKAAGMKYITITSKHHDGFAMFATQQSDWNILSRTPYRRDVLKMLADECHKQGIKLFFYHSQLDWHNPNYFPRGRTGQTTGRPENGDWYKYLDYMDAQLRELLTNYGEIGGIWFDGMWDKPNADWRLDRTYNLIHQLQPQALIGSNHHRAPYPGEDFQMFEKDLPGQNTAGFNQTAVVSHQLPTETCETINSSWGFNIGDSNYKSPRQLIQYLVRAAGYDANFLLNVGPMPNGKIQPEFVSRLKDVGRWLAKNGEAIYATRSGPIAPHSWGVTTRKGNKIYIHILECQDSSLLVPRLPQPIQSAYFLKDGSKVEFVENAYGMILKLPQNARDDYDTIVVLEIAQK
jgi:alpha-L-fucosidase